MTTRIAVTAMTFALAVVGGACRRGQPAVAPTAPPAERPLASDPVGARGIAHWDPTTRRFVEPPPDVLKGLVRSQAQRAAALAALREEAGPRGGRMVRLGDLFDHHVVASMTPSGALGSSCSTAAAGAGDR